jgi:serine/threonine protein kinase
VQRVFSRRARCQPITCDILPSPIAEQQSRRPCLSPRPPGTLEYMQRLHLAPDASLAIAKQRVGTAHEIPRFYLNAEAFSGYRVERIISTGAVGAVVAAQHRERGRVVIKLLHPQLRNDPTLQARLSREAHVLTRLASEHIVRLLDTGWTEAVGSFVVLEHLDGMDLARMLEQRRPLRASLAVQYVLQACEALRVAHGAGITHRDIKPENLFAVDRGPCPLLKLLDFGISQHGPQSFPYRDVVANDGEAQMMGTPGYMAPERILDLPRPDFRSDIWSLGVVLHELLTGEALFGRGDAATTCARIVRHEFTLEPNRALLPASLRPVIARCLARSPAERFRDVQELASALAQAASGTQGRGFLTGKFRLTDASSEMLAAPPPLPVREPAPPVLPWPPYRLHHRWPWLVLALAVAILFGVRTLQRREAQRAAEAARSVPTAPEPASSRHPSTP